MSEFVTLFRQFLYRDLAFIVGGLIVLGSLAYALRGSIGSLGIDLDKLTTPAVAGLIAAAAYVVGYAVQDVGAVLGISLTCRFTPGRYRRWLYRRFSGFVWRDVDYAGDREFQFEVAMGRLKIPETLLQALDRMRSLKVISTCIGSCLLLSSIILFVIPLAERSSIAWGAIAFGVLLGYCLICLGWIKGMQEMQFYQSIHSEDWNNQNGAQSANN
jgi:hypothetical protein